MIIFPAIDIREGRLARGSSADTDRDPVTLATRWRDVGATWVHVVDLDRAFATGENRHMVSRVAGVVGLRVQLGGGLTESEAVREALDWGVDRVVVGTGARLAAVVEVAGPTRVGLGIETRGGLVASRHEGAMSPMRDVAALAEQAVTLGVTTVVCRDLDRDGGLDGADLDTPARARTSGADMIAAGGVASLAELAHARTLGLAGVIVGAALHAGRFTLEEALAC